MAFPPTVLAGLTSSIAQLLKSSKTTISVVETACGGLISSCLLSVPGASGYYKGGNVLYTLPSRIAYGGWTEDSIKGYDGPTPAIVLGLAKHSKQTLGADWVIAESGTAGPTGSGQSGNRQPGYLAVAILGPDGYEQAVDWQSGSADRVENMLLFAEKSMTLLEEAIKSHAAKL